MNALHGLGTLEIVDGGTLTTTNDSRMGVRRFSVGTATVGGAGSTWNVGGNLVVGDGDSLDDFKGNATLNIKDQALVHVSGFLEISDKSVVNLSGGTLRFNTIDNFGRLNYTSGTIQLAGNRNVPTDAVIEELFGTAPTIPPPSPAARM